jgi:hypothetical protein
LHKPNGCHGQKRYVLRHTKVTGQNFPTFAFKTRWRFLWRNSNLIS